MEHRAAEFVKDSRHEILRLAHRRSQNYNASIPIALRVDAMYKSDSVVGAAGGGRGRPAFIPQEIIDRPLRRPMSVVAPPIEPPFEGPPLPAPIPNDIDEPLRRPRSLVPPPMKPDIISQAVDPLSTMIGKFDDIFDGSDCDPLTVYKIMENFIFKESQGPEDLSRMIIYFSEKALQCSKNAPAIFQYLYVFSCEPSMSSLLSIFFTHLETLFSGRGELKAREGSTRYRNFIRWVMAAAHHFRDPMYAPFDDLMIGLLELAQEISQFTNTEDIELYVTLMLRFHYYTSLPFSDGTSVESKLGEQHKKAMQESRKLARRTLTRGGLSTEQSNWLMLLLEMSHSSPVIDPELRRHYQPLLPGFSLLTEDSLVTILPRGDVRRKYFKNKPQFLAD